MTGQNHSQHLSCFPAFDRNVYDHSPREEVSRTGEGQGQIKKYKDNGASLKLEGWGQETNPTKNFLICPKYIHCPSDSMPHL